MRFVRTNLSPGMIVLLAILAVLFAVIVVPVILCWFAYGAITGRSPAESFLRSNPRRRSRACGGPFEQGVPAEDGDGVSADVDDDTIECEVVSARTLDENGREIL